MATEIREPVRVGDPGGPGPDPCAPPGPPHCWDRGVFTISLDFELIWGTLDLFGPERFGKACEIEREAVGRLLDLFVEFEVPATWSPRP